MMDDDKNRSVRRRGLLQGLGGATVVSLGGCLGGGGGAQETETGPVSHLPRVPEEANWSEEFTGECVASFSHYVGEDTDLDGIVGPVYLAVGNRLAGIGYMFNSDRMEHATTISPDGIEREFLSTGNLAVDFEIDHVTVSYIEHGHVGFQKPHWDVHLWLVSPETKDRLELEPGSL